MITKDIEVVHQLAEALVCTMPHSITVNHRGEFFSGGNKVDTMVLLTAMENSRLKAMELQAVLCEKLVARKRQ